MDFAHGVDDLTETRGSDASQPDRAALGWTEGQLLLTTVWPPDRLWLRAIPDAERLFAHAQLLCAAPAQTPRPR